MENANLLQIIRDFFEFKFFTINQTPVTLASLLLFVVIFFVFLFISKLVTRMLSNRVLTRLHIDEGTKYNLERLTRYTLSIVGAIVAFQFIGIDLSGLAVIFGLLSVGIGFGLQNVTSNFVAGLILLLERPMRVGDRVTIGDTEGDVVAINMRSTTILSLNNISIIVPNSDFISGKIINWTHGDKKVRLNVEVGVSYNSDLETVLRCMREVALDNRHVLKNPDPMVHLMSFGDSSWNMVLRCWVADPKMYRTIISEINCALVRKFRENGVEIPFPQRDLHLRSAIPLQIREPGP